jgi:hypothetical protein
MPQNLVQEHNFCLEFPTSKEAELPDLDFGQWQHDTDVSFLTLGHDSLDFGSLAGNSFRPTEEEAHVMGTSSLHKKGCEGAQAIHLNAPYTQGKAFAMY